MAWKYVIATGAMYLDGILAGHAYSGHMQSVNNASQQNAEDTGPIPVGRYRIGRPYNHPTRGPLTMNLHPAVSNVIQKGDFMIHGDTQSNMERGAREASARAIVMTEVGRKDVAEYVEEGDDILYVVADLSHSTREMDDPLPGTQLHSEFGNRDAPTFEEGNATNSVPEPGVIDSSDEHAPEDIHGNPDVSIKNPDGSLKTPEEGAGIKTDGPSGTTQDTGGGDTQNKKNPDGSPAEIDLSKVPETETAGQKKENDLTAQEESKDKPSE
jgi:hypothetical protein